MNVRIFLFQEKPGCATERTIATLKYTFGRFLPDDNSVICLPSIKDAAPQISTAFKDSHVVIFFAETKQYAEIKKKLAKSFNLDMAINEDLQSKAFTALHKIIPNASAEEYAHCVVPANARIFALQDGLYSGFASTSGNQTIIYLPLESGRTDYILAKQVIPFINSTYRTDLSYESIRNYNIDKLREAIAASDSTLALAQTNTSAFFLDYISTDKELAEKVKPVSRTEKRGNTPPEEYIINQSVFAKEMLSTTFGCAISNAYYTGKDSSSEKVIYIAVTGELKTSVREIHSVPGEEVDAFLARASADLCVFASDVIANQNEVKESFASYTEKRIKNYKLAIAIVAILLAAVIFAIVLVFKHYDYSLVHWFSDMKDFILPGQKAVETTYIYY